MSAPAVIGHNQPPSPIDEALEPFGDVLSESENWMDGCPVENEAQMAEVDALIKSIKAAKKAVSDAEAAECKPLFEAHKAAKARYKPTLDDLDLRTKALVSVVDGFKRKLAAEKAEAERKAREEAEAKARAAHEAAQRAADSDIDAQREAAMAQAEAEAAQKAAQQASRANDVKGLRTVTRFEITDHRALLNWIAVNRRDDLTAFIEEWARRNHKDNQAADGLRVWQEKEAF